MGTAVDGKFSLLCARISTAIFYALASLLIVVINKTVLTSYKFPSAQFLGIGQMIATILVLYVGKKCNLVEFPDINKDVIRKIFPLPILYLGNLLCGLGGTKQLSLPMFTVLRRFSILMTMIGEYYILGIKNSLGVKISVFLMVGGALIAATYDLSFDVAGYAYVLANDFFTAANGVYLKKKLDAKDLGKYGLMFYNSLVMIVPAAFISLITGDFEKALLYTGWHNVMFTIQFLLSCIIGFILIYSTLLCTFYNSALTTTIVGCLKNIIVTFIGMFIGGDYIFSTANFVGLLISVVGSIAYTVITFSDNKPKSPENGVVQTNEKASMTT